MLGLEALERQDGVRFRICIVIRQRKVSVSVLTEKLWQLRERFRYAE